MRFPKYTDELKVGDVVHATYLPVDAINNGVYYTLGDILKPSDIPKGVIEYTVLALDNNFINLSFKGNEGSLYTINRRLSFFFPSIIGINGQPV